VLASAALSVGIFGWMVVRAQSLPEGPVPIVWDKEACAYCHMHVGDPSLAGQVQLSDGTVLDFDDPGCLLSWLEQNHAPVRAVYLHHHTKDRWLERDEAAFAEVGVTPMGFGLGAVERGTPGAIDWPSAGARVRANHVEGARP
jgi:copper chaperone NosL